MVERWTSEVRRRQWPAAVLIVIGVAGALWPKAQSPLFVLNVSQSMPVGLYVIIARPPSRGEFAALRLPGPVRGIANVRGYLPANAVLIKPVAGIAPDLVCRHEGIVTINGHLAAHALTTDTSGRLLPQWSGCHVVEDRQLFVLSEEKHSFDGRYFGLVDVRYVMGTAVAITVAIK